MHIVMMCQLLLNEHGILQMRESVSRVIVQKSLVAGFCQSIESIICRHVFQTCVPVG